MIKNIRKQLAEAGKIKIGKKGEERIAKGSGKPYRIPEKHDHFTITTLERDSNDDFTPDIANMELIAEKTGQTLAVYDDEGNSTGGITALPIRLLYDDIDLNFPARYAIYKGKKVWCSGDGEKAMRGDKEITCPCELQDPERKKDKCKATGVLSVMLEHVPRIGGVWKFRTTSYNSVMDILNSLDTIRTATEGRLAGLPLWMILSPKTVPIPGEAGITTVYVVYIDFRGTPQDLLEAVLIRAKLGENMKEIEAEARKQLALPEPKQEIIDVENEYYQTGDPDSEPDMEAIRGAIKSDFGATKPDLDKMRADAESSSNDPLSNVDAHNASLDKEGGSARWLNDRLKEIRGLPTVVVWEFWEDDIKPELQAKLADGTLIASHAKELWRVYKDHGEFLKEVEKGEGSEKDDEPPHPAEQADLFKENK